MRRETLSHDNSLYKATTQREWVTPSIAAAATKQQQAIGQKTLKFSRTVSIHLYGPMILMDQCMLRSLLSCS